MRDPELLSWEGTGPLGTTASTTYSLSGENGGTRFVYRNEFKLPAGELGEAASSIVSGYAQREAESSLARLKQIAEG